MTTHLDTLVTRYLDLTEQIEQLTAARDNVKAAMRDLGPGEHVAESGNKVTVTAPSRRFNVDRAWTLLSPEQQALCVAPDARKIKAQLPQVLVEECMDAGKGDLQVRVA